VNRALERAGSTARVSSKPQNIEPMEHLGPAATALERRGVKTRPGNRNRRRLESRARARALVAEIQSIKREQEEEDRSLTEAVWRGVLDSTRPVDERARRLTAQLKYLEEQQGKPALLDNIKSAAPVRLRPDCWSVLRTIAERAIALAAETYRSMLDEVRRFAATEDRARLRQRQNER
jgi:hypothetical protein